MKSTYLSTLNVTEFSQARMACSISSLMFQLGRFLTSVPLAYPSNDHLLGPRVFHTPGFPRTTGTLIHQDYDMSRVEFVAHVSSMDPFFDGRPQGDGFGSPQGDPHP